jgi:hypothetical protein
MQDMVEVMHLLGEVYKLESQSQVDKVYSPMNREESPVN